MRELGILSLNQNIQGEDFYDENIEVTVIFVQNMPAYSLQIKGLKLKTKYCNI